MPEPKINYIIVARDICKDWRLRYRNAYKEFRHIDQEEVSYHPEEVKGWIQQYLIDLGIVREDQLRQSIINEVFEFMKRA